MWIQTYATKNHFVFVHRWWARFHDCDNRYKRQPAWLQGRMMGMQGRMVEAVEKMTVCLYRYMYRLERMLLQMLSSVRIQTWNVELSFHNVPILSTALHVVCHQICHQIL